MKKFWQALILTAGLVLLALPNAVFGAGRTNPEIRVTVEEGVEKGEYLAAVSVTGNPGIAGYNLGMGFDNTKIVPVSVTKGSALQNGMIFSSNLMNTPEEEKPALDMVTAVWGSATDDLGNGELFSVLFKADPLASGSSEITLTSRGISNSSEADVSFDLYGADINFGGVGFVLTPLVIGLIILVAALIALVIILAVKKNKKKTADRTALRF